MLQNSNRDIRENYSRSLLAFATNAMLQLENPLLKDLKIKNGSSFQIDSYTISLEDGIIYISSLGFLVVSERMYTIDDMKIVLTDGSEKNIIDQKDYSVPLSSSNVDIGEKRSFGYNQFFNEYIDCSKIDKLIYNGNTYMVSER